MCVWAGSVLSEKSQLFFDGDKECDVIIMELHYTTNFAILICLNW